MKSTYTAPTVETRGDVVRNTLKQGTLFNQEIQSKRVSAGASLSFGL